MSLRGHRFARSAALAFVIIPFLVVLAVPASRAAPPGLAWPVGGPVIRGFEKPSGPYGEGGHQGVDLAGAPGESVGAAQDGTVTWVGELPRGRFVTIAHAGGISTTYLDLDSINVARGARVTRGQVIATVSGTRDGSSARPHLHFGTYLNGHPVDPRLLFKGLDAGSFVRLCPVERSGGSGPGSPEANDGWEGSWSGPAKSGAAARARQSSGPRGPLGLLIRGLSAAWGGVCALGRDVATGCDHAWDHWFYPAMRRACGSVARLAGWAWSNRYVRAVTAGLAAAVVVIIGVIVAFLLLPISAVVAVIAGVVGAMACIGMAIYCALTSGSDFNFATCFFKSLSAGAIAATGVLSWGALSGSLAAGWAEVGLWGTLKAAAWNGFFSAIFDTGASYLLTGRFSVKSLVVAFLIGAVSGAVGKVLREGIFSERLVGLFSLTTSETRLGAFSLTGSALLILEETAARLDVLLVTCRQLALTFGGKVAYVVSWGMLTAGLNILACALAHRPITMSGVLASFLAGAAMGGIALSFKGRGISGLLSRFRVFSRGMGVTLRKLAARLLGKGISRGLKSGLESAFKKILREKEVSR